MSKLIMCSDNKVIERRKSLLRIFSSVLESSPFTKYFSLNGMKDIIGVQFTYSGMYKIVRKNPKS